MSPGSEGWIDHACPATVVAPAVDVTECFPSSCHVSRSPQRGLREHRERLHGAAGGEHGAARLGECRTRREHVVDEQEPPSDEAANAPRGRPAALARRACDAEPRLVASLTCEAQHRRRSDAAARQHRVHGRVARVDASRRASTGRCTPRRSRAGRRPSSAARDRRAERVRERCRGIRAQVVLVGADDVGRHAARTRAPSTRRGRLARPSRGDGLSAAAHAGHTERSGAPQPAQVTGSSSRDRVEARASRRRPRGVDRRAASSRPCRVARDRTRDPCRGMADTPPDAPSGRTSRSVGLLRREEPDAAGADLPADAALHVELADGR